MGKGGSLVDYFSGGTTSVWSAWSWFFCGWFSDGLLLAGALRTRRSSSLPRGDLHCVCFGRDHLRVVRADLVVCSGFLSVGCCLPGHCGRGGARPSREGIIHCVCFGRDHLRVVRADLVVCSGFLSVGCCLPGHCGRGGARPSVSESLMNKKSGPFLGRSLLTNKLL
jgi:hypothetical protein